MITSYATTADLDEFLEGGLPDGYEDSELERVLELASQDLDLYASAYAVGGGGNLKFITEDSSLTWRVPLDGDGYSWWRVAIVEATCAQAEYRLAKGDQFFVETQKPDIGSFDAQVEPRFGPKAMEALRRHGLNLRRRTATLTA